MEEECGIDIQMDGASACAGSAAPVTTTTQPAASLEKCEVASTAPKDVCAFHTSEGFRYYNVTESNLSTIRNIVLRRYHEGRPLGLSSHPGPVCQAFIDLDTKPKTQLDPPVCLATSSVVEICNALSKRIHEGLDKGDFTRPSKKAIREAIVFPDSLKVLRPKNYTQHDLAWLELNEHFYNKARPDYLKDADILTYITGVVDPALYIIEKSVIDRNTDPVAATYHIKFPLLAVKVKTWAKWLARLVRDVAFLTSLSPESRNAVTNFMDIGLFDHSNVSLRDCYNDKFSVDEGGEDYYAPSGRPFEPVFVGSIQMGRPLDSSIDFKASGDISCSPVLEGFLSNPVYVWNATQLVYVFGKGFRPGFKPRSEEIQRDNSAPAELEGNVVRLLNGPAPRRSLTTSAIFNPGALVTNVTSKLREARKNFLKVKENFDPVYMERFARTYLQDSIAAGTNYNDAQPILEILITDYMNKFLAYTHGSGGKSMFATRYWTYEDEKNPTIKLLSYETAKGMFDVGVITMEYKPEVIAPGGRQAKSRVVKISPFEAWHHNPGRLWFSQIVVEPDKRLVRESDLNMWLENAISKEEAENSEYALRVTENPDGTTTSIDDILALMKDTFCSGDEEQFIYLVRWLAHQVQKPGVRLRSAPILVGAEGTGKDLVLNAVGAILGKEKYINIASLQDLTRFNEIFAGKSLIVFNEVYHLGPQELSPLKAMITEEYIRTEAKYRDTVTTKNVANIVLISNNTSSNLFVAGSLAPQARRFFLVEGTSTRCGDISYWDKIIRWFGISPGQTTFCPCPGVFAMANFLYGVDLSSFTATTFPLSQRLALEKLTCNPIHEWLYDCYCAGEFLSGPSLAWETKINCSNWKTSPVSVEKKILLDHYNSYCEKIKRHRGSYEKMATFSRHINQALGRPPGLPRIRPRINGQKTPMFVFPALESCQQQLKNFIPGLDFENHGQALNANFVSSAQPSIMNHTVPVRDRCNVSEEPQDEPQADTHPATEPHQEPVDLSYPKQPYLFPGTQNYAFDMDEEAKNFSGDYEGDYSSIYDGDNMFSTMNKRVPDEILDRLRHPKRFHSSDSDSDMMDGENDIFGENSQN
jgi:hypothetical protein